jgi:chaperonin GroES
MLNLSQTITLDKAAIASPNLCDKFDREDLNRIGVWVHECYERDLQSREGWYRRTEAAMDLALQVQKQKTFPWPGCSNIAFPLVTIAALQFHSRAYPAIVNGRKVVNCRVVGPDPDGSQTKRANRIADHMSWQLLEQDQCWEEEEDRALINVPIVGVAWKKTYFDPSKGHNVSHLVLARDLVVDYWAKSIEDAPTKTHVIPMFRNDIYERVKRGTYFDVLEESWFKSDATPYAGPNKHRQDKRDGADQPQANHNTPFTLLEQHCSLDLDGDGYAEPYIVTIEESTQTVVRIVTRFDRIEDIEYTKDGKSIIKVRPLEYFTKIPFIPNPDGSIMDIGFGTLIGPLNESVNSTINQLFDAGTMANTAGGFLGRGAKIRGGIYTFNPFEWNRVDSTGDDLRKNIFPLPVREPSTVMFQLLTFIVEYTNRISGTTDMSVGENPGQNTPAETARTMVEQGQKVYSAIFKRIWRGLKHEFDKMYVLNSIHLDESVKYGSSGAAIAREDYAAGAASVVPVADPTITSDAAKLNQAMLVREAAASAPGYDQDVAERMYLEALQVDNIDTLFPGAASMPPPPPDVKIQIEQMRLQSKAADLEFRQRSFMITMQQTQMLNNGKIAEMQAKTFKLMEEGKSETEKNRINAFNASIQAIREENNQIQSQIQSVLESMKHEREDQSGRGTVPGVAATPGNQIADAVGLPKEGDIEGGLG